MQIAFYSGQHCHLCELAENLLQQVPSYANLRIEKFDVAQDHQLYHLYGARIPVLKRLDTEQELGWPFDSEALTEFLA